MLEALKAACAQVRAGTATGTAYLVGPQTLMTCHHVVKSVPDGGAVTLLLGEAATQYTAHVVRRDEAADVAVLELEAAVDTPPLLLGGAVRVDARWQAYGFPAAARNEGLVFCGVVQDPRKRLHGDGSEVLVLYSDQLAAGMATPIAGLSGGPALVEGRVVGHLREIRSDPEHPRRPAYGQVFATPVEAVRRLLGVDPTPAPAQRETQPTLAPPLHAVAESVGGALPSAPATGGADAAKAAPGVRMEIAAHDGAEITGAAQEAPASGGVSMSIVATGGARIRKVTQRSG